MRPLPLAAVLCASLAVSACGGEGGEGSATMSPGSDCLSCHNGGGEAPRFAAAGTVFHPDGSGAANVTVVVTVGGTPTTRQTNSVGNFFIEGSGAVTAASVSATAMPGGNGITGHCNGCHTGGSHLTVP